MSKAGKLRVPEYLGHILEAIRRIDLYVEDMAEVQFLEDAKTQDAVIRNFEIIGEAYRNIERHHPEFAHNHTEVPWGFAYEMRNTLAHGYFKVDLEIVWKTVHRDLPELSERIARCWASRMKPESIILRAARCCMLTFIWICQRQTATYRYAHPSTYR